MPAKDNEGPDMLSRFPTGCEPVDEGELGNLCACRGKIEQQDDRRECRLSSMDNVRAIAIANAKKFKNPIS